MDKRLENFRSKLSQLDPLISMPKVKAHLKLTGAFMALFQQADGGAFNPDQPPPQAFTSFLVRAVHRFELWLKLVVLPSKDRTSIESNELPPLDVVAVWHAFVLGPFRYYEDCKFKFPQLYASGPFPVRELVRCGFGRSRYASNL